MGFSFKWLVPVARLGGCVLFLPHSTIKLTTSFWFPVPAFPVLVVFSCEQRNGNGELVLNRRTASLSDIFREVDNCVTAPQGFRAGTTSCGIKSDSTIKDLAILASDVPCVAAGTFTTSSTRAAPVIVCQERLKSGRAQAVIVNSGNANCATGELGMQNAYRMTKFVA